MRFHASAPLLVLFSALVGCHPAESTTPAVPGGAATSAKRAISGDARDLIEARMRERRHGDVEIGISTENVPVIPLEGLETYVAWEQIPDAVAVPCFVHEGDAWCLGPDEDPLAHVVRAYDLVGQPTRLDQASWQKLLTFASGAHVVSTADEAKAFKPSTPDEVAAKVRPFAIEFRADRAVSATFYSGRIANDAGPVGIDRCTVEIPPDAARTTTTCQHLFTKF